MGNNWYTLMKLAIYGHDDVGRVRDQLLPSWNPYGTKRKSPNEIDETKTKLFDNGHGLGDTRDFIEVLKEMPHESRLDQYDEGIVQNSPVLNGAPLDTIADEPNNDGSDEPLSPIGENQQTMRKAKEPLLDNKPNRLPGGGNFIPVKPFLRSRRLSGVGPLAEAWAFQIKKGRTE